MAEDDVGSALTGVRPTDPAGVAGQWDDFMQKPGNRQALLQIGLQMMQPVGIGQTAGGHIAQSIGAGGEAVDRGSGLDLKERVADARLYEADQKLGFTAQNVESNRMRAEAAQTRANRPTGGSGGLTAAFKARRANQEADRADTRVEKDASEIIGRLDDYNKNKYMAAPGETIPADLAPYAGKSKDEIRTMLRGQRKIPKRVDEETGLSLEDDPEEMPPVPDAIPGRRPNGTKSWYVPDPKRPGINPATGKPWYLEVNKN